MSKKSVLKPSVLHAGGNRNAFPLGHTETFSAPLGMLLPVDFYKVPANSYFELNMENQTVMSPITRPAFSILKEHFDVFAVPMCQLLQRFDNFITGQSTYDNAAVQKVMLTGGSGGNSPATPQSVPMFDGVALDAALASLDARTDIFGCNKGANACRLLDHLGYGSYYSIKDELTGVISSGNVDETFANSVLPMNFFNLLAYQKIYYSHYANKKYESIDARAYNIDDLDNITYQWTDVNSGLDRFIMMLEAHYVQAKKDYFNTLEPYILPMGNNVNFTSLQVSAIQGDIWQLFGIPGTTRNTTDTMPSAISRAVSGSANQSNGEGVQITASSSASTIGSSMTVAAIRFAFAYDKLLRRMRAAGPSFNSQMLAQFGIKPIDERHGDAIKLGGWTNQLRMSEVTSLADSGSADLGNLGGKMTSYSSNNKKIKYTAKEDCIIMVVYHTSLDPMYHSFNVDRSNLCKYRFDWFNPVFENMGLQPVFAVEYSNIKAGAYDEFDAVAGRLDVTNQRKILGYTKRYMEYKTKTNRVHGLFQWPYANASMMNWVPTKQDLVYDPTGNNPHYSSVLPIPFVQSSFLQSPFSLNSVLTTPYNGKWNTDPFYVFSYFDAKLIANMSVEGETF